MFYKQFARLCFDHDVAPTKVAIDIGLSRGAVTFWKNGSAPRPEVLQRIADYFDVPIDYFFQDRPDIKKEPATPEVTSPMLDLAIRFSRLSEEDQTKVLDYIELLELKAGDRK